jgi:hypothetical protein
MQAIRGQDKTDETRQYRTGMPASAASNVSDDFAGHLAGARHTDAKHKPSGWKTQKKIWRARQDGRNKTRQNRDPSLGCIECFGSAKLPKTMQDSSSAQQQLHGHNQLSQAGDTEKKNQEMQLKEMTRHHCYTLHDLKENGNRNENQPCLKPYTSLHIISKTHMRPLQIRNANFT